MSKSSHVVRQILELRCEVVFENLIMLYWRLRLIISHVNHLTSEAVSHTCIKICTLYLMMQATSGGSLLSFTTGSLEASKAIVEETKLFNVTVSFGSVASSISMPCFMSHASISAELREARGLPDDLIRISAGRVLWTKVCRFGCN